MQRPGTMTTPGTWTLLYGLRLINLKLNTACMLGSMHYMIGYTFIPHVQRSVGVLSSRQMHRTHSPDVESLDLSQVSSIAGRQMISPLALFGQCCATVPPDILRACTHSPFLISPGKVSYEISGDRWPVTPRTAY